MALREPIWSALASLVFTNTTIAALFVTTGRKLRHHAQLPAGKASCPAIYLVQSPGETHERIGKGISVKRTLRGHFVMYFWTPEDGSSVPAIQCNEGLDAIDDALNINLTPANTQTLGGLVEHVYTEGSLTVDEGLLQEFSIIAVPVTILVP